MKKHDLSAVQQRALVVMHWQAQDKGEERPWVASLVYMFGSPEKGDDVMKVVGKHTMRALERAGMVEQGDLLSYGSTWDFAYRFTKRGAALARELETTPTGLRPRRS